MNVNISQIRVKFSQKVSDFRVKRKIGKLKAKQYFKTRAEKLHQRGTSYFAIQKPFTQIR